MFAVWWLSPVQVVKRRTTALLETMTLAAGDGKMGRHASGYSLDRLLAAKVTLETPTIGEANGTFERSELSSAFSWLCDVAKQTRFDVESFDSVNINGASADVNLTLVGLVELPTYRPADGTFDVKMHWIETDDGWRLDKAVWTQK